MSHEQLEELLNTLVPFARSQLEKDGVLLPSAAALEPSGEVSLLLPRGTTDVDTDQILVLLREELRDGASNQRYLASAICIDVEAQRHDSEESVDAICVHLESPDETMLAFVPYVRGEDGTVGYGELFFGAAEHEVFAEA